MSSSRTHKLSAHQELAITRAMMLGATFHYNDYGHPERARARKYHTCIGPSAYPNGSAHVVGYGYDQADAAWDWLKRSGHASILVRTKRDDRN